MTGGGWPQRYRKRPVEIEAVRLNASNAIEVAHWCDGRALYSGHVLISTLEGEMRAAPGDYVIKGVAGEFYPCQSHIFDATYEAL